MELLKEEADETIYNTYLFKSILTDVSYSEFKETITPVQTVTYQQQQAIVKEALTIIEVEEVS